MAIDQSERKDSLAWRGFVTCAAMLVLTLFCAAAIIDDTPPHAQETSGFFANLLKVYMPRRACMFYEQPVIWLHAITDALIATAYFTIPFVLVRIVRKRRDLIFGWAFWMFAVFILGCGITHVIGVADLWYPLYKVDGIAKAVTAAASIATAVAIWPLVPKITALQSPRQQQRTIEERTAELQLVNERLKAEIEIRKSVEEEREKLLANERIARNDAQRASHLKDEFLATLSHELRTPLNAMLGWAQHLRRHDDPESVSEGLKVIERNARLQAKLIEDLLDLSRIISGKLRIDVQRVELADVINSAIETVRPAADVKGIRIQPVLNTQSDSVRGDPGRLQQVVWNLLTNAIKFTDKGGRVNVALERVNSHLEVSVADTGSGIDPAFLPHVFDRFRQADASTTRKYGGLGIGLAIAKSIVEAHSGKIRAASPGEGEGATFVVELPLMAARHGTDATPSDVRETMPASDNGFDSRRILAGVRVLVVDDEPDSRDLVGLLLEECRAQVVRAGSAADALEIVRRDKPDVLVSDIGMPLQDGYWLIRRIRNLDASEGGNMPAVALTALARSEDRRAALIAGFQAHVAKPVESAELVAVVASLAGKTGRHA